MEEKLLKRTLTEYGGKKKAFEGDPLEKGFVKADEYESASMKFVTYEKGRDTVMEFYMKKPLSDKEKEKLRYEVIPEDLQPNCL